MDPQAQLCNAKAPAEPLNSIAADIIGTLTDIKSISNEIVGNLFSPSPSISEKAQEPVTLEQRLQLARAMALELRGNLNRVAERL